MLKLNITSKAESDLISIWSYTYEMWGAVQADTYLDRLETGMNQLRRHPLLGSAYDHVAKGYRRLQLEHHGVYYRVSKTEVTVIRMLHEDVDASARVLD